MTDGSLPDLSDLSDLSDLNALIALPQTVGIRE
jgi:hypothetical protein